MIVLDKVEIINEVEERIGGLVYKHSLPPSCVLEVLMQWKGLPPLEATWEPYLFIQQQFPFFHLEDKVKVGEGSNVRPPVHLTYQRRSKG